MATSFCCLMQLKDDVNENALLYHAIKSLTMLIDVSNLVINCVWLKGENLLSHSTVIVRYFLAILSTD